MEAGIPNLEPSPFIPTCTTAIFTHPTLKKKKKKNCQNLLKTKQDTINSFGKKKLLQYNLAR